LPLLHWLLAVRKKKPQHLHQPLQLLHLHLLLKLPHQLPLLLHLLLTQLLPPLLLLLPQLLLLLLPALRSNSSASRKSRLKAAFLCLLFSRRTRSLPLNVKPGGPVVRTRHDDVFRAARQGFGHQALNQRGPVVLHAQVCCHQMLQALMGDRAYDVRRGNV
jgi:hypothetical protein